MKVSFIPALSTLLLIASCATAPVRVAEPSALSVPIASAPEWTSRTIFMEGTNVVFVLTGPENAEVVELALQAMRAYLDLPVVPSSPVVAAQAIESFLKKMSESPPSDRYIQRGRGWWKVVVSKDEWDQSRARLLALFEVVVSDPAAELEKASDELLRKGRYFDAVTGFVAASAAAVAEGKTPNPARFRSALAKAQEVFSRFTLSSTTPAQTTRVGQPFASTFDVSLTYGAGAQAPAVPAALLRFSFKTKKNGRLAVTGQTVKTDADGVVKFELPLPDFSNRDSLVVLVDVNPWLEALATVPREFREEVAAFETLTTERKLQLPYTVESAARQIPMIVALADFDERGGLQKRQESGAALITALQKIGFQASGIPVNPTLLKSSNDSVVLAAWKFQGKTSGRAVYGTVNLVSVTASGSQFKAEVTGLLKVVDLVTSKPVYQAKTTKIATAADRASSVTLGFRQWAAEAAATMEAELP